MPIDTQRLYLASSVVGRLLLKKSRYIYMLCLISHWLFIFSTLALDWRRIIIESTRWSLLSDADITINDSDTTFDSSAWNWANNVLSTLVIIIADALLVGQELYRNFTLSQLYLNPQIYRCYTVCGGRKWILILLGTFLSADIGKLHTLTFFNLKLIILYT